MVGCPNDSIWAIQIKSCPESSSFDLKTAKAHLLIVGFVYEEDL